MITKRNNNGLLWVDIESPTEDDLLEIERDFKINPEVKKELSLPSERPKVDMYKNYMYMILHFPKYKQNGKGTDSSEIDFIIGKDFLVTVHYDTINPIIEFGKIFETDSVLKKMNMEHGGKIFFYLLRRIYENMEEELSTIEDRLRDIETLMFEKNGTDALESLSKLNKELIDFRRTMRMHRDVFKSLEKSSKDFFGEEFSFYTTTLLGNYERIWHMLVSNKETLLDLRQTSDSLFTARTNRVVKTLTVLTFITIPLSIIADFGQNSINIPFIGHKYDFFIFIGGMVVVASLMVAIFKKKKWL